MTYSSVTFLQQHNHIRVSNTSHYVLTAE